MGRYRKKPVVIDADQWLPEKEPHLHENVRMIFRIVADSGQLCVEIPTLEGTMLARPGDWIIRGVNGEYYPCKDEIFQKTYEAVDE